MGLREEIRVYRSRIEWQAHLKEEKKRKNTNMYNYREFPSTDEICDFRQICKINTAVNKMFYI